MSEVHNYKVVAKKGTELVESATLVLEKHRVKIGIVLSHICDVCKVHHETTVTGCKV